MREKRPGKLREKHQRLIVEHAIMGVSMPESARILLEEHEVDVSVQTIWVTRTKFKKEIAAAVEDEIVQATATQRLATLENRLAVLDKVVTMGLAEHQSLSDLLLEDEMAIEAEVPGHKTMSPQRRAVLEQGIIRALMQVNEAVKIAGGDVLRMRGLAQRLREYNAKQNLDSRDVVEETIITVTKRILAAQEKVGGRALTLKELESDVDWLKGDFTPGEDHDDEEDEGATADLEDEPFEPPEEVPAPVPSESKQ